MTTTRTGLPSFFSETYSSSSAGERSRLPSRTKTRTSADRAASQALSRTFSGQGLVPRPEDPAGVDELEVPVPEPVPGGDAVPGHPGQGVDEGLLLAEEAVEQRGLPDVGEADDDDLGAFFHFDERRLIWRSGNIGG